eukprot:14207099-Heterocapsa_arctica.AAC.1
MPFAQVDLDAEWCNRLEMSDASPGGHGRAWACFPTDLISHVARHADSKAPYTCLNLEHGIEVDEQNRCPLKR